MVCSKCGSDREVRLAGDVALKVCTACDHGEMIPQPTLAEVSAYRREAQRLQSLPEDALAGKEAWRGLADVIQQGKRGPLK